MAGTTKTYMPGKTNPFMKHEMEEKKKAVKGRPVAKKTWKGMEKKK